VSSWRDIAIRLAESHNASVSRLFQPHHVIVTLLLIGRQQPLGRYKLCDNISIGEGSVRTLLKNLRKEGYIAPEGRRGQKLTRKGQRYFEIITEDIPLGLFLELNHLVIYSNGYAILVKDCAHAITDGLRQRDEAMIHGGYGRAGATTLVMKNGILLLPPDNSSALIANEDDTLLILNSLRPENNDVVILGSAIERNLAREVAIAAAMTLFK